MRGRLQPGRVGSAPTPHPAPNHPTPPHPAPTRPAISEQVSTRDCLRAAVDYTARITEGFTMAGPLTTNCSLPSHLFALHIPSRVVSRPGRPVAPRESDYECEWGGAALRGQRCNVSAIIALWSGPICTPPLPSSCEMLTFWASSVRAAGSRGAGSPLPHPVSLSSMVRRAPPKMI